MPELPASPFLQVLVQRDDAPASHAPDARAIAELDLWADLTPASAGTYRTTTGALVRPIGDDGLARAVRHAPGFVRVRELTDDEDALARFTQQLFEGVCDGGVFTLCVERPPCATRVSGRPRVAEHVRVRAEAATSRQAATAVVTSALHRSFRVSWAELAVVRLLDGQLAVPELAAEAATAAQAVPSSLAGPLAGALLSEASGAVTARSDAERFVTTVLDRFARHLFLLEETEP